MEDIKDTTAKLANNGFLQHVFNFDDDTKKYLMNTTQYALLSLGPVVLLNKLLEDLISDFDDTKGNVELLAEVSGHLVGLITGIFFVHRLVTYIPTYSGIAYENINLFSIIVALAVALYNTQSKLGLKMKLMGERLGELWNGKEEPKKENKKSNDSPQLGQSAILSQPQPTHQASRSDYVLSHDQMANPVQQQATNDMGQNDPYGGNGQGQDFGMGMMNEPMAANGVLGSAW